MATGVGAGIGWGIGAFGDDEIRAGATFWGGGIGFGLTATVLYFLREYILYMVKAGHVAVMVELIEPFAIACLLQAFFKVTEGQTPNQEWVDKLDGVSAKFGKLSEKARGWAGPKTALGA